MIQGHFARSCESEPCAGDPSQGSAQPRVVLSWSRSMPAGSRSLECSHLCITVCPAAVCTKRGRFDRVCIGNTAPVPFHNPQRPAGASSGGGFFCCLSRPPTVEGETERPAVEPSQPVPPTHGATASQQMRGCNLLCVFRKLPTSSSCRWWLDSKPSKQRTGDGDKRIASKGK